MNESCRSEVDDLHTKCRQLEQNSTDLRTNLKTLHNRYNEQHAEMVVLKSKAYPLEHKLTALDSSVMSLLRHEKVRDQDCIALYNILRQLNYR
jgi:predicted  nucleic acid-binding Zn-ribbon protein